MEKRRREQLRRQKQAEKEQRRAKRASERAKDTTTTPQGGDPDLEGMVPGPQPGQILPDSSDPSDSSDS